jgi:CMP-N,N'-diacetyllegionaminic acid synthase
MKILALITARSGSKRIPGKNIKKLGGKPLINWSIDVATNIEGICDILVSTDSSVIAEIANKRGAITPWLRPDEISTDSSSSVDVALHAVNWYENEHGKIDGLLLLQPTSPFRTKETIKNSINLFSEHQMKAIVSFSEVNDHPFWSYKLENGFMKPFIDNKEHLQSQNLPPLYLVNGSIYLISPSELRKNKSFYKGEIIPYIIKNPRETLDIDTNWDWEIAEMICNKLH